MDTQAVLSNYELLKSQFSLTKEEEESVIQYGEELEKRNLSFSQLRLFIQATVSCRNNSTYRPNIRLPNEPDMHYLAFYASSCDNIYWFSNILKSNNSVYRCKLFENDVYRFLKAFYNNGNEEFFNSYNDKYHIFPSHFDSGGFCNTTFERELFLKAYLELFNISFNIYDTDQLNIVNLVRFSLRLSDLCMANDLLRIFFDYHHVNEELEKHIFGSLIQCVLKTKEDFNETTYEFMKKYYDFSEISHLFLLFDFSLTGDEVLDKQMLRENYLKYSGMNDLKKQYSHIAVDECYETVFSDWIPDETLLRVWTGRYPGIIWVNLFISVSIKRIFYKRFDELNKGTISSFRTIANDLFDLKNFLQGESFIFPMTHFYDLFLKSFDTTNKQLVALITDECSRC